MSASRTSSKTRSEMVGSFRNAASDGCSARHSRQPSDEKTARVICASCGRPSSTCDPSTGPSPAMSSASSGASRRRNSPTSRARASTAVARAAVQANAATSPSTSQPVVLGAPSGSNGTARKATASARSRTTLPGPTRERAPKQPHGAPRFPRSSATYVERAKTVSKKAPAYAAAGTPATSEVAIVTSSATIATVAGRRNRAATPYVSSADALSAKARSLRAAATNRTAARAMLATSAKRSMIATAARACKRQRHRTPTAPFDGATQRRLAVRRVQRLYNRVECFALLGADGRAALFVRFGNVLGDSEREAPIRLDLVRARFLLEQSDRLPQAGEPVLLELFGRAVAFRVRLLGDQGVEELALAMLLPRGDE